MSYRRVIPRDLFNEASLLKCYGALYIALERCNAKGVRFSEEDLDSFNVIQREEDGSIYLDNLSLLIGDDAWRLVRPLNSRQPWPLYAEMVDDVARDPVEVFNNAGGLSDDFLRLVGAL